MKKDKILYGLLIGTIVGLCLGLLYEWFLEIDVLSTKVVLSEYNRHAFRELLVYGLMQTVLIMVISIIVYKREKDQIYSNLAEFIIKIGLYSIIVSMLVHFIGDAMWVSDGIRWRIPVAVVSAIINISRVMVVVIGIEIMNSGLGRLKKGTIGAVIGGIVTAIFFTAFLNYDWQMSDGIARIFSEIIQYGVLGLFIVPSLWNDTEKYTSAE